MSISFLVSLSTLANYNSEIKAVFGITPEVNGKNVNVKKILVVGEASHNDYNWTDTFENFYSSFGGSSAKPKSYRSNYLGWDLKIVYDGDSAGIWSKDGVFSLLKKYANDKQKYYYQICEIAFLQRYYDDMSKGKTQYKKDLWTAENLENLRIVGGGMTSPSSLLSTGESFIRNQLLGTKWVKENVPRYKNGSKIKYAWIPDSFGIDPNVPALLEAMDLKGFGFGRIGGTRDDIGGADAVFDNNPRLPVTVASELKKGSPADQLLNKYGTDFVWNAVDGSSTEVHFLLGMYQMNSIYLDNSPDKKRQKSFSNKVSGVPGSLEKGKDRTDSEALNDSIEILTSGTANRDRDILYVPLCDDMMPVCTNLLDIINEFNENNKSKGIWAVSGTFDHYKQLQDLAGVKLPQTEKGFKNTPVSNGLYSSCPELKRLHLLATNSLLTAETLQAICKIKNIGGVEQHEVSLDDIWKDVVPSTHHAYVTGCTNNGVYENEDIPKLSGAVKLAEDINNKLISAIAQDLAVESKLSEEKPSVIVYNPNGFPLDNAYIEMDINDLASNLVLKLKSTSQGQPVQFDSNAKKLYFVGNNIPSLGYTIISLSDSEPSPKNSKSNTIAINGSALSILNIENLSVDNGVYRIEFSREKDWCISNIYFGSKRDMPLFDEKSHGGNRYYEFLESYPIDQSDGTKHHGNAFVFLFQKYRNKYPFKDNLKPVPGKTELKSVNPGRHVTTIETINPTSGISTFYTIKHNSKLVEIKALGNAKDYYSVFVKFPLSNVSDSTCITYGTPYHWLTETTKPDWKPFDWGHESPLFAPTFNFFLAQNTKRETPVKTLFALYHKGVPAWSFYDNAVYGCLWRRGYDGTYTKTLFPKDSTPTPVEYALRIPDKTLKPENGNLLRESLEYQRPIIAQVIPDKTGAKGNVNDSFTLAEAAPPAIITAAKLGTYDPSSLILRVYNPTNKSLNVKMHTPGEAKVVNALEEFVTPSSNDSLRKTAASIKSRKSGITEYKQHRSLTTLKINNSSTEVGSVVSKKQ